MTVHDAASRPFPSTFSPPPARCCRCWPCWPRSKDKWSLMFLWLVVALFVDGIDGPLARRYEVKTNWPTYDGVLLDLIIDYLTYVFIPAYALFKSGLLPGWTGWIAIIVIVYGSVIYFADTRMKTKDSSFAGFPACWNMVVLVLFALKPKFWVILALVVALTVAMFTNLKFIHPSAHRTLARGLAAAGAVPGWSLPAGRPGSISTPAKLGALGADAHLALSAAGRHRATAAARAPATLRPDARPKAAVRQARPADDQPRQHHPDDQHRRKRLVRRHPFAKRQPADQHGKQDRGLAQRRHHARSAPLSSPRSRSHRRRRTRPRQSHPAPMPRVTPAAPSCPAAPACRRKTRPHPPRRPSRHSRSHRPKPARPDRQSAYRSRWPLPNPAQRAAACGCSPSVKTPRAISSDAKAQHRDAPHIAAPLTAVGQKHRADQRHDHRRRPPRNRIDPAQIAAVIGIGQKELVAKMRAARRQHPRPDLGRRQGPARATTARPIGTSASDRITMPPILEVPSLISAFHSACRNAAPRTARRTPMLKA